MEIGFIGLGSMGGPMSRRLIEAGHKLTVFDTRKEAMEPLVKLGAEAARSPADVADRVETVMTSLPSLDIGMKVVSGEDGLIARQPRAALRRSLDHRLARRDQDRRDPEAAQHRADRLPGERRRRRRREGHAGGDGVRPAATRSSSVRPALEVFGKVFVCGDRPGLAQSMKLANNFLSATGMAASSEAIAMGVKAGLDPSLMCDVINAGSGMNTATTQKFPRSVLPGTFDYGFGMALMVKDVRLFLAEAEDFGIPVEVAKAVGSLWETAMKEHGERSDFTELAKTVEKRAGVQMRAKKK